MRTQRSRKVVSFLPTDCGVWFSKKINYFKSLYSR